MLSFSSSVFTEGFFSPGSGEKGALFETICEEQVTGSKPRCGFSLLQKAILFQAGAFALSLNVTGACCRMQIGTKAFNILLCDGLYLGFHFRSLSSTGYLISHLSYESYFAGQLLTPLKAPANSLPSVLS